ncbi:MAG: imidazole glycerol phosphate synthase subunit HisH [Pelagibacterales bacterium]|nr:imidazole glycerol phosphate synthase subunit HisH [Pelagibacterales bacterium]
MKIVVIDYGAGNVESVLNALEKVKSKDYEIVVSKDPNEVRSANYIVLPGVGAFGDCIEALKSQNGLAEEIRKQVITEKKPFLGICVGMQVLASLGYEDGENQGLCFVNGVVRKIDNNGDLKIPHMGWNDIIFKNSNHPVLKDIKEGEHFYFANSYHFICQNENNVVAQVEYGTKINAIIAKENILGIQFHPEKSGEAGLKLLSNFLNWRP